MIFGDYSRNLIHGFYIQFFEYAASECLDCADSDEKLFGNLGICHSLPHARKDHLLLTTQVTNTICVLIASLIEIISQNPAVIRYDVALYRLAVSGTNNNQAQLDCSIRISQ